MAQDEILDRREAARRRIGMIAATGFVFVLFAGALWLVNIISDQRKLDRCLSSGRKNCVEIPQSPRGPAQPAF